MIAFRPRVGCSAGPGLNKTVPGLSVAAKLPRARGDRVLDRAPSPRAAPRCFLRAGEGAYGPTEGDAEWWLPTTPLSALLHAHSLHHARSRAPRGAPWLARRASWPGQAGDARRTKCDACTAEASAATPSAGQQHQARQRARGPRRANCPGGVGRRTCSLCRRAAPAILVGRDEPPVRRLGEREREALRADIPAQGAQSSRSPWRRRRGVFRFRCSAVSSLSAIYLPLSACGPDSGCVASSQFTAKQLEKQAKKCEKDEKAEKLKVKKAIEKQNFDGARIYAQNAIRKKSEQLNYLKLASRLDAVVSRLDTQAKMNVVNKNMASIVKTLDKVIKTNNPEAIVNTMENFERQMEDLDVTQSEIVDKSMGNVTSLTTPEGEVDLLIQQVVDEHGLEVGSALPNAGEGAIGVQQEAPASDLSRRLADLKQR
eukprot:scaffold175_cov414-Prasinococcus_capsulatus_cf.AAC.9